MMYGPFVSYPDNDIPIVSVAGYAAGPDSIRVSWSVEISTCFMFEATLISCGTLVAREDEEMSGLVTGLQPDTEYTCSVHGVWSESSQLLDTPDPWISEAIVVTGRANTHSRGTYIVVSRIISKFRQWRSLLDSLNPRSKAIADAACKLTLSGSSFLFDFVIQEP